MILNADDDGTVWWLLVLLIKWCTGDMGVSGHFWLEKKKYASAVCCVCHK